MPITAKAQGKTFTFPDGTTPEQMGVAIDEYFSNQDVKQPVAPSQSAIDDRSQGPLELELQTPVPQGLHIQGEVIDQGSGAGEAALAAGTAALAEPFAGLAGVAQAINPFGEQGAGARAVEATRELLTVEPKTEAGQGALKTLGDLIQTGVNIANVPISGLAGLGELLTGQGLEQAAETVEGIKREGVGRTLGERTFEETGSPLAATTVETLPTTVLTALGLRTRPGDQPTLTPDEAARIDAVIAAGEKTDVPVLTSDIFQPETIVGRMSRQFSERIPGFGTGGKRGEQQTARIQALEALNEATPKVQAADIIENLNASANKTRVAAGKRISDVSTNMDELGAVPVELTVRSIDEAIEKLTRPGKIKNEPLVKELESLKSTLLEADQTFSSMREFRTDARAIGEKVDDKGRSQLRSGDKALLDSVISGVTDDLDSFVLSNTDQRALGRYKAADAIYAEEATKLTRSRLKTVLDKGDVNPELVNNLLFSSSPSQVQLLFKNLDASGRNNARMALIRNALDKSVVKGEFSPEKFTTQLNKNRDNFDVFFRGDARSELDGLKKLMEATGRAGEAGVVTPTGQATQIPLSVGVVGAASVGEPTAIATLLGAGTLGTVNRIYESAGVRNLLIRLGKAPKRSTLEADLLRSLPLVIDSANRSLTENTQESGNRE